MEITITELMLITGVGRSMLHHYRYMGILTPTRKVGNITVYNKKETLEKLEQIKKYQEEGKTLMEIQKLMYVYPGSDNK